MIVPIVRSQISRLVCLSMFSPVSGPTGLRGHRRSLNWSPDMSRARWRPKKELGLILIARAARDRLPTIFAPSRVGAGGLLAYGTSQVESIRRMAVYVDKVLKGANPGELSVERVTPYELIVDLKTARDIGVTMPPEVLKRADRVIQ